MTNTHKSLFNSIIPGCRVKGKATHSIYEVISINRNAGRYDDAVFLKNLANGKLLAYTERQLDYHFTISN